MRALDERIADAKEKLIKAQAKYDRLVLIKEKGNVGQRLLELKKDRSYTYDDIAKALGVSRQRAAQILKKDDISLILAGRLAKVFGVSVDYLLNGSAENV